MRYIAAIAVAGIIALAVVLGLLIQRYNRRQAERIRSSQRQLDMTQEQVALAMSTLKTIRDLQGDSSFDAMTTLEQIERLREEHYQKELDQA